MPGKEGGKAKPLKQKVRPNKCQTIGLGQLTATQTYGYRTSPPITESPGEGLHRRGQGSPPEEEGGSSCYESCPRSAVEGKEEVDERMSRQDPSRVSPVRSSSCTSCKVIGTTTCLGLSAYFVVQSKKQASPVGRTVVLGVAGGLAALGLARAWLV